MERVLVVAAGDATARGGHTPANSCREAIRARAGTVLCRLLSRVVQATQKQESEVCAHLERLACGYNVDYVEGGCVDDEAGAWRPGRGVIRRPSIFHT